MPTETAHLRVDGMMCGACARRVEKVATRLDGVTDATVDREGGRAQVVFDPAKTTPEAIAKALTEKSGFQADAGARQD